MELEPEAPFCQACASDLQALSSPYFSPADPLGLEIYPRTAQFSSRGEGTMHRLNPLQIFENCG